MERITNEERLERAKIYRDHLREVGDNDCADKIEYLFPELKESKDERIRKEILDCFKTMKQQGCFPSKHKEQYESWIAWLEKQAQKKCVWVFRISQIYDGDCCENFVKVFTIKDDAVRYMAEYLDKETPNVSSIKRFAKEKGWVIESDTKTEYCAYECGYYLINHIECSITEHTLEY